MCLGKAAIVFFASRHFRFDTYTALVAASSLANIGEFTLIFSGGCPRTDCNAVSALGHLTSCDVSVCVPICSPSLWCSGKAHTLGLVSRRTYLLWLTVTVGSLVSAPAVMAFHRTLVASLGLSRSDSDTNPFAVFSLSPQPNRLALTDAAQQQLMRTPAGIDATDAQAQETQRHLLVQLASSAKDSHRRELQRLLERPDAGTPHGDVHIVPWRQEEMDAPAAPARSVHAAAADASAAATTTTFSGFGGFGGDTGGGATAGAVATSAGGSGAGETGSRSRGVSSPTALDTTWHRPSSVAATATTNSTNSRSVASLPQQPSVTPRLPPARLASPTPSTSSSSSVAGAAAAAAPSHLPSMPQTSRAPTATTNATTDSETSFDMDFAVFESDDDWTEIPPKPSGASSATSSSSGNVSGGGGGSGAAPPRAPPSNSGVRNVRQLDKTRYRD